MPRMHAVGGRPPLARWGGAVAILAMVLLVAISVRAQYNLGPSAISRAGPGSALLGSIVQALLLLSVAIFELLLVVAVVYVPWRRLAQAGDGSKVQPAIRRRMAALPVSFLLVEALLFFLLLRRRSRPRTGSVGLSPGKLPPHGQSLVPVVGSFSLLTTTELAAALGVVVLVAVFVVRLRARRTPVLSDQPSQLSDQLTNALDLSLTDLGSGGDPRRAVIRAYERMEWVLAGIGLPAQPFETPLEYLERALGRVVASRLPIVRMTDLFERARFSTHRVGPGMRREAEVALQGLRAELVPEQA